MLSEIESRLKELGVTVDRFKKGDQKVIKSHKDRCVEPVYLVLFHRDILSLKLCFEVDYYAHYRGLYFLVGSGGHGT